MSNSPMDVRNRISRLFVRHPLGWGLAGLFIFWIWGGLIPRIDWNAIEMMIGRNLLHGNGLVVTPGDPPALWRPVLGSGLCAFVEMFTSDPFLIFRILYTASLTTFLVCLFYAARELWGVVAAHVAGMFILTSGALTARLVSHPHGISHIGFLLVSGPAVLCSALALPKPTVTRVSAVGIPCGVAELRMPGFRLMFGMGFCWGLAYLARWETLPFFAVTLCFLAVRLWDAGRRTRACGRCLVPILGFAMLFVPNAAYQRMARAHYGITGPSAISTFYASEGWLGDTKDEDEGFERAVKTYGSMESNHFSVFRAIARNPGAFVARLRINVPLFIGLFAKREFFDPVWLLLLAGFALELALLKRQSLPVAWLCMLCLSSATVCMFQIDSRYLIISLPGLLLLLCGGMQCLANRMAVWMPGRRGLAVALCMFIFGWRMGYASWLQMVAADDAAAWQTGRSAEKSARELAAFFRGTVHDARAAVLTLDAKIARARIPSMDELLLSYFSGTGIAWAESGAYPLDKIFSWKPRASEYFLIQEEALYETDLLLRESPLDRRKLASGTIFYLFRAPNGMLEVPNGPASERMMAILTRDYPSLAPKFLEKTVAGMLKPTLTYMGEATHIGKADLEEPEGMPAGHRDLLFRLTLQAEGDFSQGWGLEVRSVELRRQNATRTFGTKGDVAMLRVSLEKSGVPLNDTGGGVEIPLSDKMELWLRVCDDGRNAPDASYRCRLRIGDNGLIVSEPVPLH